MKRLKFGLIICGVLLSGVMKAQGNTNATGISLDPNIDMDFGTAIIGYSALTPNSVEVTNTGNQATGALTVALSGDNKDDFALSTTTINSIDVDGNDNFTVVPNIGLSEGSYKATVTVSGDKVDSKSFDVTFTVNPVPTYSISLDPETAMDFGTAIIGYSALTPNSVEVTNTGNQATGALTVALSGDNKDDFALSTTTINSIDVDGNDNFTVVPKTGLSEGSYKATVTISGDKVDSKSFDVTFNVLGYHPSTDPTQIVRKTGSNILICKDTVDIKFYQWGYRNEGSDKLITSIIINGIQTDSFKYISCRYIEFPTNVNVDEDSCFVQITKNSGDTIPTRYYYTPGAVSLPTSSAPSISAYPNPAKGHFSVALSAEVKGKIVVSLRNLSGQTLLTKQVDDYENSEVLPFDLNFPAGIYVLVVQSNEGVSTSKIVIQ